MTIKDLSTMTGYSVGTISRVLNNQPNVSEKARKAILEAAKACGFQPNTNAKQLKQAHSNTILVVVKGTSNELFRMLVETIQSQVEETAYALVVDYLDEDDNEVLKALQLCREKKPLGVLFLGGNNQNFLADFHKIPVPCVLVTNDASALPFDNLSSVCSNNREAARLAVNHLAELGHRKIAVIGGDRAVSDTTQQRYQGCLDAFREHEIPFDRDLDYETVRYSFAGGYRAAKNLLGKQREFTAIFAMADVMAIGAIRALREEGKRVPEDVSVVGFDGITIGQFMVPTLATVTQPVGEIGRRSVEILRQQIEAQGTCCHETVPVILEWRESARKQA